MPDEIILPYLGYFDEKDMPARQMWTLVAEGGSGDYRWLSADLNIATVSSNVGSSKTAILKGNEIGTTVVTVQDKKNPANQATIVVHVRPISRLDWLEPKLEIQKDGNQEAAYLIAYDHLGNKFTNCSSIGVKYQIHGDSIANAAKSSVSWTGL